MTTLFAPGRATSFEGLIFFVYDREAVKKEADPPENAIVYFYPPSASIEDRISICGQLIGMSHFIHGFIACRPALCKMQTEKVATVHSGKYTLALGGSLGEPDSLLIRQLETLHSLFTFYHGSLERVRMMCETQQQFLTSMNIIWDCYLHFVRHYGDFLPGVFDPLPFLDLPKKFAVTCFTKASYILQACQRRKHILGGCILYSNSILCTQFEPSITERLILLKPNQSNHPARPVKTEHVLPFGVRILNAFLTLSEYLNLYDTLAESAYKQSDCPDSIGTFPDMYATSRSPQSNRNLSEDPGGEKLHQCSCKVASSSESSVSGSTKKKCDSGANLQENEVSAVPSGAAVGPILQAKRGRMDSDIPATRGTKVKDECSEKPSGKIQDDGVSNISVKNSDEFGDKIRHDVRTGTEEVESGPCTSKAEIRTGKESNGSVVGTLIDKKYTDKEQKFNEARESKAMERTGERRSEVDVPPRSVVKENESETGTVLAKNKAKEGKNKSKILAFFTSETIGVKKDKKEAKAVITSEKAKQEKDCNTTKAALAAKERAGDAEGAIDAIAPKTKQSTVGDFFGSEHRAMGKGNAPSIDFDNRSCETLHNVIVSSAFDSSSGESTLSNVSLTMEAIDVLRTKVIESSMTRFDELAWFGHEKDENTNVPSSSTDGANCEIVRSSENNDAEICSLLLGELITQVCQTVGKDQSDRKIVQCSIGSGKYCQVCADVQKSSGYISRGTDVCGTNKICPELGGIETCTSTDSSVAERDLERGLGNLFPGDQETQLKETSHRGDVGTSYSRHTDSPCSDEVTETNSSEDLRWRTELIKTPIVCDSFAVRNLNSRSPEKFLEKSFSAVEEGLESERRDAAKREDSNDKCSSIDTNASSEERLGDFRKTGENVLENPVSDAEVDSRMPVGPSEIQRTENLNSNDASSESLNYNEYNSEIHISNGHEGPSVMDAIGVSVDSAQEEVEEDSCYEQWQDPQLPAHPCDDEGGELWFEEDDDDINQVEGLTHVNLYVQAHSKVVLILLAEEGLNTDCNAIKALWETSLNQLGELEFLVKQSSGDEPTTLHSDEYSFLVYDGFERNMKGNLDELVHQVDHLFCETTKVLHEQFENCSTLKDVLLRNRSSAVYGKRNLGRGTYFHWKSPYRTNHGVPSCRDPFLKLEKRAAKVVNKDHGVNVF